MKTVYGLEELSDSLSSIQQRTEWSLQNQMELLVALDELTRHRLHALGNQTEQVLVNVSLFLKNEFDTLNSAPLSKQTANRFAGEIDHLHVGLDSMRQVQQQMYGGWRYLQVTSFH